MHLSKLLYGTLLFVSGYFVRGSYDKRGAQEFLKEKAIRLLFPLAVNDLVLAPVLVFGFNAVLGVRASFTDYCSVEQYQVGGSVGWFVGLVSFQHLH